MSNDLISREALKKEVEHLKEIGYDTNNEPLFDFIELTTLFKAIDNAPTVEFERPKGEWGKWIVAEIQCPNCFKYFEVDYYSAEQLNKCPGCGADMKVGADMKPQDEWICPNCDLYDPEEGDYCQYAGECTMGCHECRYFKQKDGTE